MKKLFIPLVVISYASYLSAQQPKDLQGAHKQKYLYAYVNELLDTEKKINYIAIAPSFHSTVKRIQPLDTGEGKFGYIIEPHLDVKWPLFQKRVSGDHSDDRIIPILGYSRIYMNYGIHSRFVKQASGPIVTPTGRFGFRYDKPLLLRMNKVKQDVFSGCFTDSKIVRDSVPIELWFMSAIWHHYSNGQAGFPFYISQAGDTINRNNYFNGDFSTNFIKFIGGYKLVTKKDWTWGISLGYSFDYGRADSFLAYTPQQLKRYGKARASLVGDLYIPRIKKFPQSHVRFDSELVTTSNLSKYPYPNNLNRFGYHVFYEINFLRSLGLMVHYYRGRDYLNIRYDDPVWTLQVGATLEINRYTYRRFDVQDAK